MISRLEYGKVFIVLNSINKTMSEILTKRLLPIIWDRGGGNTLGSLKVTITPELIDLGVDIEKDDPDKTLSVSVVKTKDGKKRIVIEKIDER